VNWVDLGCGTLLLLGAILGAVSGLLWQVARLVIFAVSMYVTLYFHAPVGEWLAGRMPNTNPTVLKGLSYFVAFVGTYVVLFIVTLLIEKAMKAVELKPMDRFLGALLGGLKAGLVAGVVLMGIVVIPIPALSPDIEASTLGPPILSSTRALILAVPEEQKKQISDWFADMRKRAEAKALEVVRNQAATPPANDAPANDAPANQPPASEK